MTKKDYIIIANALRKLPVSLINVKIGHTKNTVIFEQLLLEFCDAFAKDNPRFNRDKFIQFVLK